MYYIWHSKKVFNLTYKEWLKWQVTLLLLPMIMMLKVIKEKLD